MVGLSNYELMRINGGGINAVTMYVVGAIVTFVIGAVAGYKRPYSCTSGK